MLINQEESLWLLVSLSSSNLNVHLGTCSLSERTLVMSFLQAGHTGASVGIFKDDTYMHACTFILPIGGSCWRSCLPMAEDAGYLCVLCFS